MVTEYRYRTMFNCSLDEYLATPRIKIRWMLEIDSLTRKISNGG